MSRVFVDTAAWVALLNTRDEIHQSAKWKMDELRQMNSQLVTTELILLELANMFCAVSWRSRVTRFVDGLRQIPNIQVIDADALLEQGWKLFRSRPDKDWSLTDCTSVFLMKAERIDLVLSSAHHFEQAGFTKLL